ncbi:MAG: 4-(cytidine 5'-diphospho)-2-C-methyl-D-erythritol kinase [Lactobacillus sp.]|nr:4-(cytidine 5'-diphospho)-2-C-methyl-D-erythritol kinase [Lactobacillus sp.]
MAPAKLNLAVDITGQYPDGAFQWQMVSTTLNLFDYVRIKVRDDQKIIVSANQSYVPAGKRNLAFQAARLLQQQYHVAQGAEIDIEKHIPVAAGLGGGSSDAAAVLRGLNQLWHLQLSKQTLVDLALDLDEDVPFCIWSQVAEVRGRGNEVIPVTNNLNFYVVVVKPDFPVSTRKLMRHVTLENLGPRPDHQLVINGLTQNNYGQVVAGMGNVLEAVTARQYPEILRLKQKLLQFGADGAAMSGSGPTVYGLCASESRAKHVLNSMRGFCQEVYLCQPYYLAE